MNKTDKKIWSKDFEILDNRKGQEEPSINEEGDKINNKWLVVNKVTGEVVYGTSKKDAQNIVDNAPAYAELFGDGTKVESENIITPTEVTEEVVEEAPVEAPKVTEEQQKLSDEISDLELELTDGDTNSIIEENETEISNVKQETKKEVLKLNDNIKKVRADKTLSKESKEEQIQELKDEILNVKEDSATQIQEYKEIISEAKKEQRGINTKIKKLKKKLDAISEPSTESVDVQESTRDSETVGEGDVRTVTETQEAESKVEDETKKTEEKEIDKDVEKLLQQFDVTIEEIERTQEGDVTKDNSNEVKAVIKKQVDNAKKSLDKVLKNVPILVYETEAEFKKAMADNNIKVKIGDKGKVKRDSDGNISIYINLSKANSKTVAHEVFHALLLREGRTSGDIQKVTDEMLQSIKKTASKTLIKKITEFSKKYPNPLQSEESIAELFGMIASSYTSLNTSEKNIIKRWLSKIAQFLNLKNQSALFGNKIIESKDKDVLEFLNTIGKKVATGEVIRATELGVIDFPTRKRPTIKQVKAEAKKLNVSQEKTIQALKALGYNLSQINRAFPLRERPPKVVRTLKQDRELVFGKWRQAWRESKKNQKQLLKDFINDAQEIINTFNDVKEIKTRKFKAIQNKIKRTNFDNTAKVEELLNYITKTFRDASYVQKIQEAEKNKKTIRKKIRQGNQNANLLQSAEQFVEINFKNLDANNNTDTKQLDEYLRLSNEIVKGLTPDPTKTFSIKEVDDYTNEILKEQEENTREKLIKEITEIFESLKVNETNKDKIKEIDDFLKTLKEIDTQGLQLILSNPITEENQKNQEALLQKLPEDKLIQVFNQMSKVVDVILAEDKNITREEAKIISDIKNANLSNIKKQLIVKSIDVLNNFIVNQSLAGAVAVQKALIGENNATKLAKEGVRSRRLKLFFSPTVGRLWGNQLSTIPLLTKSLFFKSTGLKVLRESGFTEVTQGNAKAILETQKTVDSYIKKFGERTANNKSFNDEFNIIERGMFAFVRRTVEGQQKLEFNRNKKLIEDSIKVLEKGKDKEQKLAVVYKEVYDKILKDSNSIVDVDKKVDTTNKQAVKWWTERFVKVFPELAKINLEIYNEVLEKEINYIPVVYRGQVEKSAKEQIDSTSSFIRQSNVDTKQTGILMKTTKPSELPKDKYVSLDFDINNANTLEGGLKDVYTAAAIRQVSGFLDSPSYQVIIPTKEEREIFKTALIDAITRMKGKDFEESALAKKANTILNRTATLGVGYTLGGATQIPKQTISVLVNTLINAQGLDFSVMSNKEYLEWLDKVGTGVSIRGLESQAAVERINKQLDKKIKSKAGSVINTIEDLNEFYLKALLQNPDVWVAKVSFASYYKQSLKRQGKPYKDINWETHKPNKKAVEYAQNMVDEQQNISDAALYGKFFKSRNPAANAIRKFGFTFANFMMNAKTRMYTDIITLSSRMSSVQDKKDAARGLASLGAEVVTFKAVSYLLAELYYRISLLIAGKDDDDESFEKRLKKYGKGITTTLVTDFLSPIPQTDIPVALAFNFIMRGFGLADEDGGLQVYDGKGFNKEFYESFGTTGIAIGNFLEFYEMIDLALTGEYVDYYGNTKTISSEAEKDMLLAASGLALYLLRLVPQDIATISRNIEKISKKDTVKTTRKKSKSDDKKKSKKDKDSDDDEGMEFEEQEFIEEDISPEFDDVEFEEEEFIERE